MGLPAGTTNGRGFMGALLMLDDLKERVCRANRELVSYGLVALTWGNASGIDRQRGLVAIKPSGLSYEELAPERIVVVDLDGAVVAGEGRPSSDTPTHLMLYRQFAAVGGVVHTHSRHATMFAQARAKFPVWAPPMPITSAARCR